MIYKTSCFELQCYAKQKQISINQENQNIDKIDVDSLCFVSWEVTQNIFMKQSHPSETTAMDPFYA